MQQYRIHCIFFNTAHTNLCMCVCISGVARGGGQGGASAPGRRPEGGAKILPMIFLNIYIRRNFKNFERIK